MSPLPRQLVLSPSCMPVPACPHVQQQMLRKQAAAGRTSASSSRMLCNAALKQVAARYHPDSWAQDAATVLAHQGLPATTTPQQLWQHLAAASPTPDQQQQQLKLDLESCRLLMAAAAATCSAQQQYNQLQPLLQAVPAVLPQFELADFRQLLQLCAQARQVPDMEWLASIYYADTGGLERFYKQEPAAALVLLLSDLSAMLGSIQGLVQDMQHSTALLKQQQTQHKRDATNPQALEAEVEALQAAVQQSNTNLLAIQQDPLLAGELSAVAGYWLLRRFLPEVQQQPELVLQGLCALPGLGYRILDADDANVLTGHLTAQLQSWSPTQLAAAVTSALPCLGDIAPTDGQQLALLFAAVGAASSGLSPAEAAKVLLVLAQLPGYAPDAQVAQSLLTAALQPPLVHMTARQLYQLLQAAGELGATPTGSQLQQVQTFLSS